VWRRMKESVVGTESYEEPKGGKLGIGKRKEKESVTGAVGDMLAQRDQKFNLQKLDGASKSETGGPLDQLAQQTVEGVSNSTKSWADWVMRR